jgi:hypothetical protein
MGIGDVLISLSKLAEYDTTACTVVNGGYTWDLTKSTKNIIKKLRKLISQLD